MAQSYEWCGFCGKAASEVERIIAGPENGICNECIKLMHGMLDKPPAPEHFTSIDKFRQKHDRIRPEKS
jgi:ATP-dependent protease Clp ATPase subunit